ncbi:hypothetical protein [Thioflexithrix psekupsensis]|uniref:DUF3800 domain-containing protein n=1 Tax=Thioflexithrix psekupsensis TaxID=1570016 RepID=A0A251X8K9_9GAMM|nr:hypothetical protein [Thioflexithrix psekupsensis]OUD14270.1 hypothetical protein TPSD3_08055 [Thioflexithrix psekupsensis]
MKIYLVCDESGAKGYSNKTEKYEGETGVFAGVFIPENKIEDIREKLNNIANSYFINGKQHITDLPDPEKESLRSDVYGIIKDENLVCIHEAIHVEGFYAEHRRMDKIKNDSKANVKSDIKISGNPKHNSLHVSLFQGLFCKSIAYCLDTFGQDYELVFLSDNIDNPVLKNFKETAENIIDFSPTEKKFTGYDTKKQEIVKRTMIISFEIPESYGFLEIQNTEYEIEIEPKNSGLTLLADVLANSINYLFTSRKKNDIGKPLNDEKSIKDHPLINQFYGLMKENELAWVSDIIYMHSKEKERNEQKTNNV